MKSFAAGMNKDTELLGQPEGTYRDALNMNLNYTQGSLVNEEGVFRVSAVDNFIVCGTVVLDDDRIVLFGRQETDTPVSDDDPTNFTHSDQIVLYYPKESNSVVLYQDPLLNFQPTHRVVGTHRKNQAGETLVYFTDGYFKTENTGIATDEPYISEHNPPRVINVDKQYERRIGFGDPTEVLYGNLKFDANNLTLTPYIGPVATFDTYDVPPIDVPMTMPSGNGPTIQAGGALNCGAYYMSIAYVDDEGQETNYFMTSNPVYIANGSEKAIPTTSIVGGDGQTKTNKSITWSVSVPSDGLYKVIQPSIIRVRDEVVDAVKLDPVQIDFGVSNKITYTGLEDVQPIDLQDLIVDDIDYMSAQTLTQQNNRLYLGNLKTSKDIGYQGYANSISIDAVTQTITQFSPRAFDTVILNYGYSQMLMQWGKDYGQTFKRDHWFLYASGDTTNTWTAVGQNSENVNALSDGIQYGQLQDTYAELLSDLMSTTGNETKRGYKNVKYSYNLKGYRRNEVYAFYISFVLKNGTETYAYHIPGREAGSLGDDALVEENDFIGQHADTVHRDAYNFHTGEFKSYNSTSRVCEIVNTMDHVKNAQDGSFGNRKIGFWENANEEYPDTPDFNIGRNVGPTNGEAVSSGTGIAGQKVRHHKMPSNTSRLVDSYTTEAAVINNAQGSFITEQVSVVDGATNTSQQPQQTYPMRSAEDVNILGIKLSNIKIPKHILDQVQGYKIYYAKRKPEDKTILGQSLAIPAHPRFASTPEQSVVQAKKGPYYRGWYLYGGLRGDQRSGLLISPLWRTRTASVATEGSDHTYLGNPVFTFHDFSLLRKKADLSSASHVEVQYGVIFRHFLGGPGQFIPPAPYAKLKYSHDADAVNYASLNNISDKKREVTTLPSSKWVSPELQNTVSFTKQKGLTNTSYVVDISDKVNNSAFKLQDGSNDPDALSDENYQLGRIIGQENDDNSDAGPSVDAYRLGRVQRVRAYFTGMFIGSAYVDPYKCLRDRSIITGRDSKTDATGSLVTNLNYDWEFAGNNHDSEYVAIDSTRNGNLLSALVIANKSISYIPGNTIAKSFNSGAFQGATFVYNNGGETSILIGLESGLPLLRGHLPGIEKMDEVDKYHYMGLTRWSESQNYYFPDAPDTSHGMGGLTRDFEKMGSLTDHSAHISNFEGVTKYDPSQGRGLNFATLPMRNDQGLPMAWIVNLCAAKTDVFQPFDKQELVWTGYYVPIDTDSEAETYYGGTDSPKIFGGDTYISKYAFRTTSQSYGHCHFRLNNFDPGIKGLSEDDPEKNPYYGLSTGDYYAPGIDNQDNGINIFFNYQGDEGGYRRDQGDVPLNINSLSNSYGTTNRQVIWRVTQNSVVSPYNDDTDFYDTRNLVTVGALMENNNWIQGTADPVSTLFEFIVESEDNIELRHNQEGNESTEFFPNAKAKTVIFKDPTHDYTASENMLYAEHYSAVQDKKVTIPIPAKSRLKDVDTFQTRIARSNVDGGSLADGYRKFRALEFKDIDANRGEIKNMFSIAGTLYIHTKRALFLTKGKEELQLSAVTAFIGSGNIFVQDPDELGSGALGMGGTDSRHAHVTTEYGHFYVNRADRAVYSMSGNQIQRVSDKGMQTWFRDNLDFKLADFGIDLEGPEFESQNFFADATTADYAIGFTIGYDPKYKRVLITKREPIPTQKFIDDFYAGKIRIIGNVPTTVPGPDEADAGCIDFQEDAAATRKSQGARDGKAGANPAKSTVTTYCGPIGLGNPTYFKQGGWTMSYYPEKGVWGSRHSYLPDLYFYTTTNMYSVGEERTDDAGNLGRIKLWKHDNEDNPGNFYGIVYNSELEFVDNRSASEAKVFSSVFYWADSYNNNTTTLETNRITSPGFTSFYVYNTTQVSGTGETLNYLSNARLVNKLWNINTFRDLTKTETLTEGELISSETNVAGNYTSSVITNQQTVSMFLEEGRVNPDYIDSAKSWYSKAKFVDHFLAVRLINDNSNRNLLHLHGAGTNFRKSYR